MVLNNWAFTCKRKKKEKKNLDTDLTPIAKINSKWIIGLNVKHKHAKLLEGENLNDLEFGNNFFFFFGISNKYIL